MYRPVTRRQVAAILARHGYEHNPTSEMEPEETAMVKTLGAKPDEWISAYINDTEVCFSTLPQGKIHVVSYDVPLNPKSPRVDPDQLEQELLAAEDLVRQARWAIITHVHQVQIAPIPKTDGCPLSRRNGTRKP